MLNPMQRLAEILVNYALRRSNLTAALGPIFAALFSTSRLLLKTAGPVATCRALFRLRRSILNYTQLPEADRKKVEVPNLDNIFNKTGPGQRIPISPAVASTITTAIKGTWNSSLVNTPIRFLRFYTYFLGITVVSSIFPAFYAVTRYGFGAILTSLGIAWSESLSAITILREVSSTILDFVQNMTDIYLPRKSLNPEGTPLPTNNNELLSIAGLLIIGVTGLVACIMFVDYLKPEVVRGVPGVGPLLDTFYSVPSTLYNWTSTSMHKVYDGAHWVWSYITGGGGTTGGAGSANAATGAPTQVHIPTPPSSPNPSSPGSITPTVEGGPNNWE